jgi:hypothetical protein
MTKQFDEMGMGSLMTSKLNTDSTLLLQLDSTMVSVRENNVLRKNITKRKLDTSDEDLEMIDAETSPNTYLSSLS